MFLFHVCTYSSLFQLLLNWFCKSCSCYPVSWFPNITYYFNHSIIITKSSLFKSETLLFLLFYFCRYKGQDTYWLLKTLLKILVKNKIFQFLFIYRWSSIMGAFCKYCIRILSVVHQKTQRNVTKFIESFTRFTREPFQISSPRLCFNTEKVSTYTP